MHNCRFFELRWKKPMKMMNSIIMTGFGRIEFLETMLLQTQSPAKCVDTILAAALEAGGKDNITAIVLEINR